jgi:hypothetical protein
VEEKASEVRGKGREGRGKEEWERERKKNGNEKGEEKMIFTIFRLAMESCRSGSYSF